MVFNNKCKTIAAYFCVLSLGCFIFFMGCTDTPTKTTIPVKKINPSIEEVPAVISIKIFEGESGWGYDIFRNGKKYIHQTSKPAMRGNIGFKNKLEAQKVAEFVVAKIEKGISPPSVTPAEVDSLTQSLEY